jgi:hypothetical protein
VNPAPYVMPLVVDDQLRILLRWDPDGNVPLRERVEAKDRGDADATIQRLFTELKLTSNRPLVYLHSGVFRGVWHTAYACLSHYREAPFEQGPKRIAEYQELNEGLAAFLPDKPTDDEKAFVETLKTKLLQHVVQLARERIYQR